MSDAEWILPEEALPRAHEGTLVLPPPQVYEMTRISQVVFVDKLTWSSAGSNPLPFDLMSNQTPTSVMLKFAFV